MRKFLCVKHKLLETMWLREERRRLDERVEVDNAYLGGERSGVRLWAWRGCGRGAPGKTPFVAAVQTSDDGRPLSCGSRPCQALPKRPLRSGRPAA
ncbi:MAG: hypothetical protein VB137_15910 [Burkholderia sp.]